MMKNALIWTNSGLDIAEENIFELEDIAIETIHNKTSKNKKNLKENKQQ